MELKGLKINFLGDSITERYCASSIDKCFVSLIGARTGAVARNYGIGGTSIARQHKLCENDLWNQCFIDRVDKMDEDADLIVVFGGTNDFGHGTPDLGKLGDTDEYTFFGGLRAVAEKLIVRYPTSEIVFMTPLHRLGEDVLINQMGDPRPPLSAYADAVIAVANYYGFPVLDLFRQSGIQPNFEPNKKTYTVDGLHPNDLGMERLYNRVTGFLKAL